MTGAEFLDRLSRYLYENPEAGKLTVLAADGQCATTAVGYIGVTDLDGWPTEYCVEEQLPAGATQFLRVG